MGAALRGTCRACERADRLWLYKSYLGDLCRAALHRDARPTVQAYLGIPQYRSPYMDIARCRCMPGAMRQHAAWAKLTLNLSHATQLGKPKPCCMDKAFLETSYWKAWHGP